MASLSFKFLLGVAMVLLAGGGMLIACYLNVKSAVGEKERRFLILSTLGFMLLLAVLFGLMVALPSPYNLLVILPFLLFTPFLIYRTTRRRQLIRELEQRAG